VRIGELIESRRKEAGMSLQDVADACGISKGYVWEIENGKTVNIGILLAIRLSICMGLSVNMLAAAALESSDATS
jgi:transcriptional regulator with XRE-family HTH domain